MQSLKELYRIGKGPSSSHTIGPENACLLFLKENPTADFFKAELFGSLAKTGRGHCTDKVIKKVFAPKECEIVFNTEEENLPHPNTLDLIAYDNETELQRVRVLSVGGGSIVFAGQHEVVKNPFSANS